MQFRMTLVFLMVAGAGFGTLSFPLQAAEIQSLNIGDTFPDLEVESIEGIPLSLRPPSGNYLLLLFWDRSTVDSDELVPDAIVLYRRFHEVGLNYLCVMIGQSEDSVYRFAERWQVPWPQVMDEKDNEKITDIFGNQKIPSNILIDDQGTIVAKNLSGPDAHTKVAQILDVDLDTLPLPERPTPRPEQKPPQFRTTTSMTMASGEIVLSDYLKQKGYTQSVIDKPILIEQFKAVEEKPKIQIVAKNSSGQHTFGWYQDKKDILLFQDVVEDVSTKIEPKEKEFGLFLTCMFGQGYKWYTDPQKNNGEAHAKAFPTIEHGKMISNSYLLFWEDVPIGMLDDDFQDIVVQIDGVIPSATKPFQQTKKLLR